MNEQKFCTLQFLIAYFSNTFPVRTVMLGPLKDGAGKNLFKLALQNPGASPRFASILKSSRFFLLCVCTAVEKVYWKKKKIFSFIFSSHSPFTCLLIHGDRRQKCCTWEEWEGVGGVPLFRVRVELKLKCTESLYLCRGGCVRLSSFVTFFQFLRSLLKKLNSVKNGRRRRCWW